MAIISFSRDTLIDYVPEYGGNRASDNPCVVRMRFVPYKKVQEYSRLIAARGKGITDADIEKKVAVSQEVQEKQFIESVESVSGFFADGREITDPKEFFSLAPSELIFEILVAMQDSARLTAGQRKN